MVTGVVALTGVVAIWNAAETVAPAVTVTEDGAEATDGLLLVSVTVALAEGADDNRVTVFWVNAPAPPTTELADRFTEATPSGVTIRLAVTFFPK
jgi:hypothetical protein